MRKKFIVFAFSSIGVTFFVEIYLILIPDDFTISFDTHI
jgi:hypothetical protein